MFFTNVFFLAKFLLPLVKFTFTIIGSILGVIPTATDNANNKASFRSFLIKPYITNTATDITTIYLINIFEILFIPFSKLVGSLFESTSLFILPIYVFFPVVITIPVPSPLTTLVPIKHIFGILKIWSSFSECLSKLFSIGTLSPVKTDWFINKSLLSIKITSAGTTVPASSVIISPIATFSW